MTPSLGLSTSRRTAIRLPCLPDLPHHPRRISNPVRCWLSGLLHTWGAVHSKGLGPGRNGVAGC